MKRGALFFLTWISVAQAIPVFFYTSPDEAFLQAKNKKFPILIHFYGIWCPPCNQLEDLVFDTQTFMEKSQKFVLLKLDADAVSTWKLREKYQVGGYPTVVFANPAGEEVYRVVGFRPLPVFLKVMELVFSSTKKPLASACHSKNTDDLWRCAVVCAERGDKTCASKAFQKLEGTLKKGSPRYLEARTYFVEEADNEDLKRNGYEKLISEYPDHPKAALWVESYVSLFEEASKEKPKTELLEKVVQNITKMSDHPDRDESGITRTDLLQVKGQLLEKLGRRDEAKEIWRKASNELQRLTKENELKPSRGLAIERVHCLEEAGQLDEALSLARNYRGRFPDEFTFHFQTASLLFRAKRYTEALPAARKSFELSYGDNRIRSATLLLKLLATAQDKTESKTVYEAVQKEFAGKDLGKRTQRYLQELEQARGPVTAT